MISAGVAAATPYAIPVLLGKYSLITGLQVYRGHVMARDLLSGQLEVLQVLQTHTQALSEKIQKVLHDDADQFEQLKEQLQDAHGEMRRQLKRIGFLRSTAANLMTTHFFRPDLKPVISEASQRYPDLKRHEIAVAKFLDQLPS